MYVICRLCGGPGTAGDGSGAPCGPCIRRVVGAVREGVRPEQVDHAPAVAPMAKPGSPLEPLLVERMITGPAALALSDRAFDLVLAATLPIYAVEIALRLTQRTATRRIQDYVALPRVPEANPVRVALT